MQVRQNAQRYKSIGFILLFAVIAAVTLTGCSVQSKYKVRSQMTEEELAEVDALYAEAGEDEGENGEVTPAREIEPFLDGVDGAAFRVNGMDVPAEYLRNLYGYLASFRTEDAITLKQEACEEYIKVYAVMSQWPDTVEPALDRMDQILAQVDAGVPFTNLIVENSQEPGADQNAGDLGEITRGMMVKPFEMAVFTQPVGEVVGPFPTIFGWHLLEVTSRDNSDPDNPVATAHHLLLFHSLDPENGPDISNNLIRWANLAEIELVAPELEEVLPWLVEGEGSDTVTSGTTPPG
jgi:peptidyl-prolyl cis-trans isomerase C